MKMKVLFLDIDGVINSMDHSLSWYPSHGEYAAVDEHYNDKFDPRCVNWLRGIIELTNCQLVISSTWRNHIRHDGRPGFDDIWKARKMPKFIGKTPRGMGIRGNQIREWLETTEHHIEQYCIIYDDTDMLDEQLPFFVNTNSDFGITEKDFFKALAILGLKRNLPKKVRDMYEKRIQDSLKGTFFEPGRYRLAIPGSK